MSYTGSVDLISGIRPKNNGTFPLVNAKDVYIDDQTRLNSVLDSKLTGPTAQGSSGQFLVNNGDGTTSWTTIITSNTNLIHIKPEIYYQLNNDLTISLQTENDIYLAPTIFDINIDSATIYLDENYCCTSINKFDIIQYANKKAIVYDKDNNLIFDGTNYSEGIYHFKCSIISSLELSENLNEKWIIFKSLFPETKLDNIIQPTATFGTAIFGTSTFEKDNSTPGNNTAILDYAILDEAILS